MSGQGQDEMWFHPDVKITFHGRSTECERFGLILT